MVDIVVSRPGGGLDVTRRNPRSSLYVTSDPPENESENTPVDSTPIGSIRLVKRSQDNFARIERKSGAATGPNAVWNASGLHLGENSLELGNNFTLKAAAHFLKTENSPGTADHEVSLIPHIDFSELGSGFPHAPVLDFIRNIAIFSGTNFGNEFTGTVSSQQYLLLTPPQIINRIIYVPGFTSASAPILHKIFEGTDNTGLLINEKNLPANFFFSVENTNVIDSPDNPGTARFTFLAPPVLTVGQTIQTLEFTSVPSYNAVEQITVTGSVAGIAFFELENVLYTVDDFGIFSGAVVNLGSDFGFTEEPVNLFIEMSSASPFSLERDDDSNVLTTFKTQPLKTIEIVMAEQLFTTDGDAIVDNNFDYVIPNRFP